MMSKPSLLLIFLTITTILTADHAVADPPTKPNFFTTLCVTSTGNYTANSTYETNLKSVLSDLIDHGSLESFYNTSSGATNTVYGQYYCRGDIGSQLCGECIQQAAQTIISNCTLFKSSIVWYQECTLRYSNESMVGIEAEFPKSWANSPSNVSDSQTLASVLETTVNSLIEESTQGTKPTLFATKEAALSPFESVYTLVQCSPDLNGTQCKSCLRSTYAFIPFCCVTMSKQVAIFYASCQLRYSTFNAFYFGATSPPPPPSTAVSPPTTTPPPPDTLSASPGSGSPPSTTTNTGASVALRSSGISLVLMIVVTFLMLMLKI